MLLEFFSLLLESARLRSGLCLCMHRSRCLSDSGLLSVHLLVHIISSGSSYPWCSVRSCICMTLRDVGLFIFSLVYCLSLPQLQSKFYWRENDVYSSSYKNTSPVRLWPCCCDVYNVNYLLKGPVSK